MEVDEKIARPFKTLNELYKEINNLTPWPETSSLRKSTDYVYQGTYIDSQINKSAKVQREDVPKTILCHDLKGGYLEDKFIYGSNKYNSYHFYHWNAIDTFIYFSHYFITIPPYGWINAAHEHGVKILGTLITENAEGKEIWNEILKSQESIIKFADALITLSQFYKFEGWLLNIENELNEADIIKLTFFVQYLTTNIHNAIENSEIIWYDSVIKTGKLSWQNELNEKNDCFFDRCDGIFLNYNWNESGLIKSAISAQKRNRVKDIYVGLDVWGRGCPGGGGFNSAYALQKIRQQGLSTAIFAPAWTFEYFGPETFPRIENIFWAQLMPFLFIHVPIYENERFTTTFCRGVGKKYYEYGTQIMYQDPKTHMIITNNNSFYNMSMQRHQAITTCPHLRFISIKIVSPIQKDRKSPPEPQECTFENLHEIIKTLGNQITFEDKPQSFTGINCIQFSHETSYEGGGCLKLFNRNVKSYHRLFCLYVEFPREIRARVIYRECESESQVTENNQNTLVLLLSNGYSVTSFLPRETIQYGLGWKMCIFQTNMRSTHEIGLAMTEIGNCYIGKIVLEETRYPYDIWHL